MAIAQMIPQAVLDTIRAAPKNGDVISVLADPAYEYNGQILKVETLSFQSDGRLILSGTKFDWIAVVAKTIKFSAPREGAAIAVYSGAYMPIGATLPTEIAPYPQIPDAGATENGQPGPNGQSGARGADGEDGAKIPILYLITNSIVDQAGGRPPGGFNLFIFTKGNNGNPGSNGQNGQAGGDGGNGGASIWKQIPFPPAGWCEGGAGFGGNGGMGGAGGDGGNGGDGSSGGDVFYAGSIDAIRELEFGAINNVGGRGSNKGAAGRNGRPGRGGARGAHFGGCGGGGAGNDGSVNPHVPVDGVDGDDGQYGKVLKHVLNVADLFV